MSAAQLLSRSRTAMFQLSSGFFIRNFCVNIASDRLLAFFLKAACTFVEFASGIRFTRICGVSEPRKRSSLGTCLIGRVFSREIQSSARTDSILSNGRLVALGLRRTGIGQPLFFRNLPVTWLAAESSCCLNACLALFSASTVCPALLRIFCQSLLAERTSVRGLYKGMGEAEKMLSPTA